MTTNPSKYKETACQEQEIVDMKWASSSEEPVTTVLAALQNGQEIRSNFFFLPPGLRKKITFKYFLVDKEDARWINNILRRKANGTAYLSSLKSFSNGRKKKLYVRAIPSETQNSSRNCKTKKFFAEDVLELIPIALKQQNTPIDASDDRLEKYRQKWKCTEKYLYNSIDLKEFKEVLEEFDINKEEITIVPDVVYKLTAHDLYKHPENIAETFSPDGKKVMEPVKAAFVIFQTVCGYNWSVKSCKKHSKCFDFIRDTVISAIKEFEEMDQNLFVTVDYVGKIIEDFNKSICKSPKDEWYKYSQLIEKDFNERVYLHDYWQITDSHGLPRFSNFLMDPLENNFPVWNARMFLIAGWIQQFFDLEMRQLRTFLATELVSRCPEDSRDEMNLNSFKRSIVLGESEESDGSEESGESSDDGSSDEESTSDDELVDTGKSKVLSLEDEKRKNMKQMARNFKKSFAKSLKEEFKVELKAWEMDQKKNNALEKDGNTVKLNLGNKKIVSEKSSSKTQMPIEKKMSQLNIESESENLTTNKNAVSEKETKTKNESSSGTKYSSSSGQNLDYLSQTNNLKKENILEKGFPKVQSTNGSAFTSKNGSEEKVGEKKASDIKTESKCCQKCLRTSEMCNEAKKDLATTKKKLEKIEKNATKYDELEKKIKEQDKEIDELKTGNSQFVKNKDLEIEQLKRQVQEMEKMKSRLAQYESTGAKLKENNKKDTESRDHLQEKVAQLEAQLKIKEHNSQVSQLEREILEKDETIALLQETNMRVTVRNEEQAKNIQNLLDRLTIANSNQTR